jgi:glucose/arabinose dehydrogenase
MRLRNKTVGAAICIALFVAAPAQAQSAAQNAYSHPAGQVQQQLGGNDKTHHTTPAAAKSESGQLPFTGLDIALVMAAGGVLLAMGFGIRRVSRATEAV